MSKIIESENGNYTIEYPNGIKQYFHIKDLNDPGGSLILNHEDLIEVRDLLNFVIANS